MIVGVISLTAQKVKKVAVTARPKTMEEVAGIRNDLPGIGKGSDMTKRRVLMPQGRTKGTKEKKKNRTKKTKKRRGNQMNQELLLLLLERFFLFKPRYGKTEDPSQGPNCTHLYLYRLIG